MAIVILGANGQIGSQVLKQLQKDFPETDIIATVRHGKWVKDSGSHTKKCQIIAFDPFADNWQQLGKVEILINCIGIINENATMSFLKAHLGLTEIILKNRQLLGMPKIIQLSALGADPRHISSFLSSKGKADELLLSQPDTFIIRPSIVCTTGTMMVRKINLAGKVCRLTGGSLPFPEQFLGTKIQPICISDLREVVSYICKKNTTDRIIEVAGPEKFTLKQLLSLIPGCKKILPLPEVLFKSVAPLITTFLPGLLSKEQTLLLQEDNISDADVCQKILGRPMSSTLTFWHKEIMG